MFNNRFLLLTAILQFGCGCASYSTLQTATTLDKREFQMSGGTAFDFKARSFSPEAGIRFGAFERMDLGAKIIFPELFFGDLKFQVWKGQVDIAADAGFSYFDHSEPGIGDFRMVGFYPMVLVGQKHWYTGVKCVILSASGKTNLEFMNSYEKNGYSSTNFVLGATLGDNFRFVPELNAVMSTDYKVRLIPAMAFQLGFK